MNLGQQALKLLCISGGALLMITGIAHLFTELEYTKTLVCIYLSIFSTIIWSGCLIPTLVEKYYSTIFPFMSNDAEKGIFIVLISFLCFGREFGLGGTISGILLCFGGCGYIIFGLFGHPGDQSISATSHFKPAQSGYEPPEIISN